MGDARELRGPVTVYFIEASAVGAIKIGASGDLERRFRHLCVGSPTPLTLLLAIPGTLGDERRLHSMFAAERAHGEWFRATPQLRRFIRELALADAIDTGALGRLEIEAAS